MQTIENVDFTLYISTSGKLLSQSDLRSGTYCCKTVIAAIEGLSAATQKNTFAQPLNLLLLLFWPCVFKQKASG